MPSAGTGDEQREVIRLCSGVTLSVYNTLGQLVSTLVNDEEQAGYHEVEFDGSDLAGACISVDCRQGAM